MKKSNFETSNLEERNRAKEVRINVEYNCPQCNHYLCYEEDIRENFCPRCGQRLDWANVDNGELCYTEHGIQIKRVENGGL